MCLNFVGSPPSFNFKRYQRILWNNLFWYKNLLDFVSPNLNPHNRYCLTLNICHQKNFVISLSPFYLENRTFNFPMQMQKKIMFFLMINEPINDWWVSPIVDIFSISFWKRKKLGFTPSLNTQSCIRRPLLM